MSEFGGKAVLELEAGSMLAPYNGSRRRDLMLAAIRRAVVVPQANYRWLVPAVTLSAFGWLLAQDAVAPLAVYLLQLFLSF